MLARVFHEWERRLAAQAEHRVVRQFEWGQDWVNGLDPSGPDSGNVLDRLHAWADQTVANSEAFFALPPGPPSQEFLLAGDMLSFPSAVTTPHRENNIVQARFFPKASPRGRRRAVLVLPQWNAPPDGHAGLCRLLNRFEMSALRLTLPYHDARKPSELRRADYIVSANIGRTTQVCRQAVLDARRAIGWLREQGYESIGILGTSLGSCLSMLTAAHEPLVRAAALNLVSPYFADVVWEGLSTAHVRQGLDGRIDLDALRRVWMPISPFPYLDRMRGKGTLLVYARYDLSFPVALSRILVAEFRARGIDPEVCVMPCGHYSIAKAPFNWIDGLVLSRFLNRQL